MTDDRPEFSVAQFFPGGEYEYLCRFVPLAEAWRTFDRMTKTLGARLGTTTRVIITDGGDYTCAEWKFGEGLTYPTKEMLEAARRESVMTRCPRCGTLLMPGPRGGAAQNFYCTNRATCRQGFNDMGPFGVQEIGEVDDERFAMYSRGKA